jgi:hypothetical protein
MDDCRQVIDQILGRSYKRNQVAPRIKPEPALPLEGSWEARTKMREADMGENELARGGRDKAEQLNKRKEQE